MIRKSMILDACVLIDFIKADRSVLKLVLKHIGSLHVTTPGVSEVNDIKDESELLDLGVAIIEPELEDAFEAAGKPGPTSFQDNLCFLAAKRHRLTCVTNDKHLRKRCKQEGVPRMWGLELLSELHEAGGISRKRARAIAHEIRRINPKYTTAEIVARFEEIILIQENERS